MKQKNLGLSVAALTVAAVAAIFLTRPGPSLVERELAPLSVTTSALEVRDVQPWRVLTGRFEPVRTAELKFEVAGRVKSRHVEAGMPVAAGEVLLEVDDRDYRDALVRTQSELDRVAAEVERDEQLLALAVQKRELQESEVARLETLVKRSLVDRSSLDTARQALVNLQSREAELRYSVSVAAARLDFVRSERNRAGRDLERTRLIAPFGGIINRVEVEVGSYVNKSRVTLTLVDVSGLDLLLHVNGRSVSALAVGQPIEIEVPPEADGRNGAVRQLTGEIASLQVAPDPETFTYEARVRVPGDGLRAGMVARAQLPQPRRDRVITVPIAAVQYLDGRTYVFVEYDSALKRTRVSLGSRIGDRVIVEEGLGPGTRVVVHDVDKLSDGQRVMVTQGVEPIN